MPTSFPLKIQENYVSPQVKQNTSPKLVVLARNQTLGA